MAILSMTGYGRGSAQAGGITAEVEIGSVNRRQFDLRVNLPRTAAVLEPRLAKAVRAVVNRGCVTVNASLTGDAVSDGSVVANLPLARAYLHAVRQLQRELGLKGEIEIAALLQYPDVVERRPATAATERLWHPLQQALETALDALIAMRRHEGAALQRDIENRFRALVRRHGQLARLAPSLPKRQAAALRKRIALLAPGGQVDPSALARETAIAADRCDIAEELVRLASHFEQAGALAEQTLPAGRALDFLCQEMLREINTIGAKAADARISQHVIAFKTDLERVREQVQNVE